MADTRTPILLLLPGLDGTGKLFTAFLRELPASQEARIVALPGDRPLGYEELAGHVRDELPRDRPFVLLAESFSGPLALRLAAARPPGLAGLILVASFHARPVPRWLIALRPLLRVLLSRPPPGWAARHLLVGWDAPAALVAELQGAVAGIAPGVAPARAAAALDVDAADALARCTVPILCLTGSRDRLLRPALAAEMRALQPALECRAMDAPHLVLQRQPREAARLVSGFVAQVAAGGHWR